MHVQAAYDELIHRAREDALLASCSSLLEWDEETYMPRGGVEHRGNQMALLAGIRHEKATEPRLGELLSVLEQSAFAADPYSPAAVNIRELRRVYQRATRLPRHLVEELARTTPLAQQAWLDARQNDDYSQFLRWLDRIVSLKRCEAEALGYRGIPYDALLDDYEPGATSQEISALFAALRQALVPLVGALGTSRRKTNVAVLQREFPIDRQRTFGETVAAGLGFDFRRGRLDVSPHPFFTGVGPGDCRITTRFSVNRFNDAFFGILHEVGHALYEQGLDPEHYGTPMGEAASLGVHESQARLWENTVGRSRPFWDHFFPLARQIFHETLQGVSLDQFYFAINHVEPSLLRVGADEVTYNLHILVRFELEKALIDGDLQPVDVPAAWNEAYRHYLGISPNNDVEGCLQDGHWGCGLIGYFPTYTLGNLMAAQLFARAGEELGDLAEQFARGEFTVLLIWLRDKVYRQGHRYPAAQLIEKVTGSPLDYRPLVHGLHQKYGEIYGV